MKRAFRAMLTVEHYDEIQRAAARVGFDLTTWVRSRLLAAARREADDSSGPPSDRRIGQLECDVIAAAMAWHKQPDDNVDFDEVYDGLAAACAALQAARSKPSSPKMPG